MEKPRKRVGVYIEEELIERFKQHFDQFGDFTTLINDLLRTKLNELDSKYERVTCVIIDDRDGDASLA